MRIHSKIRRKVKRESVKSKKFRDSVKAEKDQERKVRSEFRRETRVSVKEHQE